MLSNFLKTFFEFVFAKLVKGFALLFKKKQISNEVDKEGEELEAVLAEVEAYLKEHNTHVVPPHLEVRLIDAARRRNAKLPSW